MSRNKNPFVILISVFFFWGFVAAGNDILIPVFKEHLHLEQWQSQMVSFAFYVAYTVGSVAYIFISRFFGGDLLNRIGYNNGIALGLFVSACGTWLFYPAAQNASFLLMITGLFIVGLGFSLQQTAANPMVINSGDPAYGSQRLSLAGGINNIGTTIGPLVLSFAIFGGLSNTHQPVSLETVKNPYLWLGLSFLLVAAIFKFLVPRHLNYTGDANGRNKETMVPASNVLSMPQVYLGMPAIFLYVGVEVATASNLPEYMRQYAGTDTSRIAPYVSLFWASLMIGRWTSAANAFNLKSGIQKVLRFIMPYLAFAFFLLVNTIAGNDVEPFYIYAAVITVMIVGDILSKGSPEKQLIIFSVMGVMCLCVGMFTSGILSVYAFISVGLFCSTLWPCIFTIAIRGLGEQTNQASGYLIMMIMGGGIVSLFQGWLAGDNLLGIKYSYITGVLCFAYLVFYGLKMQSMKTKN